MIPAVQASLPGSASSSASLWAPGVLKEGWVYKRSRYLKVWRQRWLVLCDDGHLCAFSNPKNLLAQTPTEAWPLDDVLGAELVATLSNSLPEIVIKTRGGRRGCWRGFSTWRSFSSRCRFMFTWEVGAY